MQLSSIEIKNQKKLNKKYLCRGYILHKELEKLNDNLCYIALAMPWANGLFTPINRAIAKNVKIIKL